MSPPPPPATSLPPGFRFHPTDEELVMYYLKRKASGNQFGFHPVTEIDVYNYEPWELPDFSLLKTRDQEWYFITRVDRKYGNGSGLNRTTGTGYWKSTGCDRGVRHKSNTIGMKKTLTFYSGRAPDGKRTNWVMHEYRLLDRVGVAQDLFVVCRVLLKSGLGQPREEYYAPFLEEDRTHGHVGFRVPGGEGDDDLTNGDETRGEGNDIVQEASDPDPETSRFVCELLEITSEDCGCGSNCEPAFKTFSLFHNKRLRPSDPNSEGSQDSITITSQDPIRELVELRLFESVEAKECDPQATRSIFDAAALEKLVPPGYLKLISDLENEIVKVSKEKENLKAEVMRAQFVIDILKSRIEVLSKGNDAFRPVG